MSRLPRAGAGLLLAAFLAALTAAPGSPPPAAAASCSSWSSDTQPPPTIRVFRNASGAVDTVDFRAYVKNVLSREWIGSWTTESLRSGALAVKNYAWYQVLHWRGYVAAAGGQCFDVFDTTRDQVYDPSLPTWAGAASAVDATWATLALKAGRIFPTYYNAGTPHEACGANANGWKLYQWGTQGCGLAGRSAAQIMAIYYTGVVVSQAPPAAPPPTTPSPAPSPSPPQPATTPRPSPTASIGPSQDPAPTAQPTPTPPSMPTPTPSVAPTPLPDPSLPGGGQSGVVDVATPPPAPPPQPRPIVVRAGAAASATAAAHQAPRASTRWRRLEIPQGADMAPSAPPPSDGDLRLASFHVLFPQVLRRLAAGFVDELFPTEPGLLLALLPSG